MNQDEFFRGWALLVTQPWGQRYNRTTPDGQPAADAKLQLEFYFDKLKHGTASAWFKTAEQYAMAREWPTVMELRTSMRHYEPPVRQLARPHERSVEPMPAEVQGYLTKVYGSKQRTFGPWIDESVPAKEGHMGLKP